MAECEGQKDASVRDNLWLQVRPEEEESGRRKEQFHQHVKGPAAQGPGGGGSRRSSVQLAAWGTHGKSRDQARKELEEGRRRAGPAASVLAHCHVPGCVKGFTGIISSNPPKCVPQDNEPRSVAQNFRNLPRSTGSEIPTQATLPRVHLLAKTPGV